MDLPDRRIPLQDEAMALGAELRDQINNQKEVADKFSNKLEKLLPTAEADGYRLLHERTEAAANYFVDQINKTLTDPLQDHIDELKRHQKKSKNHMQELRDLRLAFSSKVNSSRKYAVSEGS